MQLVRPVGLAADHPYRCAIVSARVTTVVYPLEWGGWGYRIRLDGARGVILRNGPGVELVLSGGRRLVVSVREPATVAALVNALVDRDRG